MIFNLQRFSIHDGPGIRTTVFLKGCPLRCQWCHNPESWSFQPQIFFQEERCILCGACVNACTGKCHRLSPEGHRFQRETCTACGKCAEICPARALELCGRSCTIDEVMEEIRKDMAFYRNSGGGVTLSGGEPMAQFPFIRELLEHCMREDIHTCLETCGFAPWDEYREIIPFVKVFLFDIKTLDADKHRKYTGVGNELILENLRRLDDSGTPLRLRCPLIPGLNDSPEELRAIRALWQSLKNIQGVDIEPYHPLGIAKARRLGTVPTYQAPYPSEEIKARWKKFLEEPSQ